jgi:DGQHR domain-containing protein
MEAMFSAPTDAFDSKFRGTFGRFGTKNSNPAYYFLTAIPIRELKSRLQVAADALPIRKIAFSQMIQRDVNAPHVAEIKDYLLAGNGKAVFFPPLLVSIINKDSSGEIQEYYESQPKRADQQSSITVTWDANLFQLTLYGQAVENDKLRKLTGIGLPFYFHDYGAHLELNSSRSNLVVIDGQHRYKALASLYEAEDYRSLVEGLEVPICVVFSPFAVGKDKSGLDDLRDIFVTVNNEAKTVSGHFLHLLDDYSHASEAVRQLAELWKADTSHGYSMLHHLEWNTHDSKKAGQINRDYSITAVSVIVDALKAALFAPRTASTILQLTAIQEKLLEIDPDIDIDEINDSVPISGTKSLISMQIFEHVAKPLHILLSTFTPYAETMVEMKSRMAKLAIDKGKGERPELVLLYAMFEKHQIPADADSIQPPEVRIAYASFVAGIDAKQRASAPYSKLAVFQQALIRAWVAVSKALIHLEVLPSEAASMVSAAFAKTILPNGMQFIGNSSFTQRMLWNGDRVIFKSDSAKRAWADLMLSTFGLKSATESAASALESLRGVKLEPTAKKAIVFALRDLALGRVNNYLHDLEEQIEKFYKAHYAEILQNDSEIDYLRKLQLSAKPEDKKQFSAEISKIAGQRYLEAQDKLLAAVNFSAEDLAAAQ